MSRGGEKNVSSFVCVAFCFCLAFLGLLFMSACTKEKRPRKCVIGLSQCMLGDAWRQVMVNDMRIEACNYDDVEIVVKDANNDNDTQIEQIRELIDQKVDVLIVSPYQSGPVSVAVEEAYEAGIPTIITDRKVETDLYTTFIGADNYAIGQAAGRYASRYLPKDAVILEIWGLRETSPAQERHQGFVDVLKDRSDLTYRSLDGEYLYDTTAVRIKQLEHPEEIDFVYSHNDMMAIVAREYFLRLDSVRGKNLPIIGVDAVPGAGLDAVSDGRINASFLYSTGGGEVVRTAMQIFNGQPVDKMIPLPTGVIDQEAARTMLLQAKQMENYKQRIETQRARLDGLFNQYGNLQDLLLLIALLLIGFILLLGYVYFINRKVRKVNQVLLIKNQKEEQQKQKLIALNAEIKEVTAQELQFFTNISHEVRTPLTLILTPLDRLIAVLHDSPYLEDLNLIRKNAYRLLRVINQLLDFRKVEDKKEKLKICEVNFISFASEVKSYFDSMAEVQHITYTFVSDTQHVSLWIDLDLMEKVLINLLSNAFKFTPEGGAITLRVSDKGDKVCVQVEDNGRGIQPEHMNDLFTRFYTENRSIGTGIGLQLVKEYVQMHDGEVEVESRPNERTVFSVYLKKGKEHFSTHSMELLESPLAYEASHLDDSEVREILGKAYPYTVLIVEDDNEMRSYLASELRAHFQVLTAENGKVALEIIEEKEVSLVLSDVMMPEMNGFELCRSIKTNLAISHIPVILLTALSDERQRTFGITRGADGYIQKPFLMDYVKVKIIRVLEERERLRTQWLQKLQDHKLLLVEPEKAESMDDVFLRRFVEQIEKVYADPEYNVEKLSDKLGLSRGHLHRKIKDLTGVTPVEFLRNYRLKQAALLLRQKKYAISEVAYRTGFSSPAYFTKCFKVVYGMTPTEFK